MITASWAERGPILRAIRQRVFVDEQGVPANLEWDEQDTGCLHALALTATEQAVGSGRLLPDGRIGRMAVLPGWRGLGIGRRILDHLVQLARAQGQTRLELHAQAQAVAFYRRAGFSLLGEPFLEAGIVHRKMACTLAEESSRSTER